MTCISSARRSPHELTNRLDPWGTVGCTQCPSTVALTGTLQRHRSHWRSAARHDARACDYNTPPGHAAGRTAARREYSQTRSTDDVLACCLDQSQTRAHHRRRLHRGNRELCPGTHARTGENVAFCSGTFHGCALI